MKIKSLAISAKCSPHSIKHISNFLQNIHGNTSRQLTENEINYLSSDRVVKNLMILLFLALNISLEYLRKHQSHKIQTVSILELWSDIKDLLIKKLFLSRDFCTYFKDKGGINSEEFKNYLKAVQTIKFEDRSSEMFVSNQRENVSLQLFINNKYEFKVKNTSAIENEVFTIHDRKTCFHHRLYDPFKFEEQQTWQAHRYINKSLQKKSIDSIFTVMFAIPELTVLNIDGTYLKISVDEIQSFIDQQIKNNEIDIDLYNNIKKDYPKLFLPELDQSTIRIKYQELQKLIDNGIQQAVFTKKPLLVLISEVHGSKESFLFHIIILVAAQKLGISNLLAETINIYHCQHGWDAKVEEILRLLSFAKDELGFDVKDLERELHYNNTLSPYPYHKIPESLFGIEAREASWIIDTKKLDKNAIMIVGSGHMNSLLNSELQNTFHILPIDCGGDKKFSNLLNIYQHNFISLDKNLNRFSLDELIKQVISYSKML